MTVSSSIADLATRIAVEIKASKNRSNHTGTQAISTVTGLQAALDSAGGGGAMVGVPIFIQSTAPTQSGPYAWWNTSGGNLTLFIEDGI